MKKKIVYITGAAGYLGRELVNKFFTEKKYNLYVSFDDVRQKNMNYYIQNANVIIHMAAKHPSQKVVEQEINATNYESTKHLYDTVRKTSQFIFLSSDCVFGGDKKKYFIDDKREPLTLYGKTKKRSEDYIINNVKKACIIRTSMLYGSSNKRRDNFINYLFKNLDKNKEVELYSDVWARPTHVHDLADFIDYTIEEEKTGVFHACGKKYVNRYAMGKKICDFYGFDENLLLDAKKPFESHFQSVNMIPSVEFEPFDKRNIF